MRHLFTTGCGNSPLRFFHQVYRDEAKILSARYAIQRDKWHKNPKNIAILKTLNKDRKKRGKKRMIRPPPNIHPKRPLPSYMR